MTPTSTTTSPFECAAARRLVHAAADGEIDAAGRTQLDAHLAGCAECRAFRDEIDELAAALAGLDDPALPDEDLAAVFARTVDAPAASARTAIRRRRAAPAWAAAGLAAAALVLALLAPHALRSPAEAPPSEEELARAAQEIRYVFGLTDQALQASGRAAIGEAVGRGVRPALRRVPVLDSPLTGGVTP